MAQKPQYEFHYRKVKLLKTEELGIGSYGAVCKAMCDDLPCAAKILHRTLFQFTPPGTTSIMQKFEQECCLLSAIKHPNIIQYLGTYQDPESRLPVLLMELMDESLTQFLKQSHKPLPYHTEVNLCHDITLALSYLHSNGIIHRDLSSNNVLLIAGSRAKVTDFGMAKLHDVKHSTAHLTPLTQCPGTVAYMSPEALGGLPLYTEKLDSFSFGVLCVQIMTRQFPDPGDRFQIMEINDPRIPSGRVKVDIPEIERRQSHIGLIDPAHPLLQVALNCLNDRERERPSCHELCGNVSTLKASPKYTESVQQSQVNNKATQSSNTESVEREIQQSQQIRDLQQQLNTKDDQLLTLSDKLRGKEQEIQQQIQQIQGLRKLLTATRDQQKALQQQLTTKDEQLADKRHQLQQKEAICQQEIWQIRQQLQSSELVTAEFQQNLLEKERVIRDQQRQIQELQQQLKQKESQSQEKVEAQRGTAASGGSIKLRWRDGGRAPRKTYGQVATVDESVAYFQPVGSNSVVAYNSTNKKWSELPDCPNCNFSLAIVNHDLTAIGGEMRSKRVTNSLLSFTDSKWTEQYPAMPTKRWLTTAVCTGKSLVVAGGMGEGGKYLTTVEVMDTETLQWSTASRLPQPLYRVSATVCGDQAYILGGFDQNDRRSKSVFTCSLATLLQSCQAQSLAVQMKTLSVARGPKVWHQLADTPYYHSACTSLHGQLLAVGGNDSDDQRTTDIHIYNTATNSWEVISHLKIPRQQCSVAVLPQNELMVVGGRTPGGGTDSVEIATIV